MDWSQLRTILWLRYRLTRNQWARAGQVSAVISTFVAVVAIFIGAAGGIVGILAGVFALAKTPPQTYLGVWDAIFLAFLFFWMVGIVSEIQRSETIDIGRLLHLPVSLKDIFLVNYIASNLTLCNLVFLPGMLGLCLGLMIGKSVVMVLMPLLVLSVVFMVSAWTYCLRGWLVTLMVNKRRRRTVIAIVTFVFILLVQLPNLINITRHRHRPRPGTTQTAPDEDQAEQSQQGRRKKGIPEGILTAHNYVPFLWVGNGAMALAEGRILPALWGSAGALLLGGLGLRRAYRSTIRFYQGHATTDKPRRKTKREKVIRSGRNFLERQLPFVSDDTSVMVLGFFRCLARAPEIKIMLGMNFLMLLFFGTMMLARRRAGIGDATKPFVAAGIVGFTFFGLTQLMFNHFGHDRNGFRALVLSPVLRKHILLAKNITLLPLAACIGTILLLIAKFALSMPITLILAGLLQLLSAFFLLSMAGNLVSVLAPYRVAPGSLKPTKTKGLTTLLIFLSHMLFPIAVGPVFLPAVAGLLLSKVGWLLAAPATLLFSVILLAPIGLLYRLSLNGLGDLLLKREQKILEVVTLEVE